MGAIETIVGKVVSEQLGQYIPSLQQGIQQVTGFVQDNQAQLEFDNLCNVFPAAKALGIGTLNQVRGQYSDSSGRQISMADALALLARDNPRLLQKQQPRIPQTRPKVPPVEQPRQQRGSTIPTPPPEGVRSLRARMEEQRKSGMLGNLAAVAQDALARHFGGRE